MFKDFLLRVKALVLRRRFDQDLEDEVAFHLAKSEEKNRAAGSGEGEARQAARRQFGNPARAREEMRTMRSFWLLETLGQDLRYGLRLLRKSPMFTLVAGTTLALGIGANTAIFSVVDAVLLRSLPYTHPEELVVLFENNEQKGVKVTGCSYPDLAELQRSGAFAGVAGVQRHDLTLTGYGDPSVVTTVDVTPEIFSLLHVSPLAGRYLFPEDETRGAAPVALVSEGLWRTRLGGNPNLVGASINLDHKNFTVVGIMPAGFRVPVFGDRQEIWIPMVQDPLFSGWIPQRGGHWLRVVGRLNSGVSIARAQSEADAISSRLARDFPTESSGWAVRVAPLQQALVEDMKTPLLVLFGAVGLVLLIVCVNIANLLLARATSRSREMALRQALGAERGRIIRQLLTESVVLGLLGAILGVILAYWSTQALASLLPSDTPAMQKVQVNGGVLAFALLLSLAASIGFGLAPALLTADSDFQSNLKEGAAGSGAGRGRARARGFLAAAEIALAVVLVIGAGLLVRSLITLTSVDPGFNVAHIVKAEISLPQYQYTTAQQWTAFSDTFLERIQAQPGLKDSAFAVPLPLADGFVNLKFGIADHAAFPPGTPETADYVSVSPEYFRVMGIPLLRGRLFAREDTQSSPRVTVISESMARLYFRDEDPIGKRLVFGFPPDSNVTREIVGVVGSVRDVGLTQEPGPMMYVPFAQAPFWGGNLVVKSSLPLASVVGAIHEVVRGIDKDLPVTDIATMPDVVDASMSQARLRTWLLGSFGVVALLLAAAGVFGVVSCSVASRTREFGVRIALGASRAAIGKMVLLEGLGVAGIGVGVGVAGALALARFLKSQLYGVGAYDPLTFFVSAAVLLAVALSACYLPARRATHVDPMEALRHE
jgi:putative ABC transport system permease protein